MSIRYTTDLRTARGGMPGSRIARRQVRQDERQHRIHVPRRQRLGIEDGLNRRQTIHGGLMNAEVSPPVIELIDVRDRIRTIVEDSRAYPQSRIAKEVGVSATTLSQWLNGNYAGDNDRVAMRVASWLAAYDERQATGGLPEGPEWVATPSAETVIAGLRYAQLAGDVVVIYGGAGVGKSRAIARYRTTSPNVFSVELQPVHNGIATSLQAIATEALGMRDHPQSSAALAKVITARLRGTGGVLVIDEAQHLSHRALDQIRAFHDATGVGIVFVGNTQVYSTIAGTGGQRAAYLDRLHSRVGKRIQLRRASPADADAFLAAWGIDDAKTRQLGREITTRPGALRTLNKVIRLASTYAQAAGHDLTFEDVAASWRELGGMG